MPGARAHFWRPVLLTAALIAVYRLGCRIPMPFLDLSKLGSAADLFINPGNAHSQRFSIFVLGIMPYVSAYMFVEIASLAVPYLKRLRSIGHDGRLKLKRIALGLTVVLGTLQAAGIISGLREMTNAYGISPLSIGNHFEYMALLATLVGAVFVLVFLCEWISCSGIGNGVSLLVLSGTIIGFSGRISWRPPVFSEFGLLGVLLPPGLVLLLAGCSVVLLKSRVPVPMMNVRDGHTVNAFEFNLAPSAKVALGLAGSLIMLPATLSVFFDWGRLYSADFRPGTLLFEGVKVILICGFSYLFAYLFFSPKRRVDALVKRGWTFPDGRLPTEKTMLKRLFICNLPWTILLCALAVVPHMTRSHMNSAVFIGGAAIVLVMAVGLDLFDRLMFMRENPQAPVVIAEFHDVYDAAMIKNHLTAKGIDCHMQGFYHRHLLYFFGPYIDVRLMVNGRDSAPARNVIEKYYGGLGLMAAGP